MTRPKTLVSYAQNHEDIVLARIFEPWNRLGHWVDIGAGHPTFDSVTRLFSDFGWTGVNVEPLVPEFELLCAERLADVNLNCAIGSSAGTSLIYEGPPASRGTSTMIPEHARNGRDRSEPLTTREVEVRTLSSVLDQTPWEVDFIKIDVEGMESSVIASADWSRVGAEVVVVEATLPNSNVPSHQTWESTLLDAGYSLRLFDGLNRFYSRVDRIDRTDNFEVSRWYPACPQDRYVDQVVEISRNAEKAARSMYEHAMRESQMLSIRLNDLMTRMDEAEGYAKSLQVHLTTRDVSLMEATEYARSLEREIDRLKSALALNEVTRLEQTSKLRDLEQQVASLAQRLERNT